MGEFKVDPATIAFRLALAEASEQEQARADALSAFWQRPIFAATWPSPNEAPRTLTNSQGETALPLFTGLDTLELGADRFSWREPNGSIRFREMSAREAFRYALTRQVNFVVVDVGFEHNVEFAREEFEPLVLQKEAQESASRNPPPSASTPKTAAHASQQPSTAAALRQQISAASSPLPAATSQPIASAAAARTPPLGQSGQAASSPNTQSPRQRSEHAYGQSAPAQGPRHPSEQARASLSQSPVPHRDRSEAGRYASAENPQQRAEERNSPASQNASTHAHGAASQGPQAPRHPSEPSLNSAPSKQSPPVNAQQETAVPEPGRYRQNASPHLDNQQGAGVSRHRAESGQYRNAATQGSEHAQAVASQSPQPPRHRSEPGQYRQNASTVGSENAPAAATQNPQPPRHRSEPGQYRNPSTQASEHARAGASQSPQPPRHRSEPGQYAHAAGIAGSSRPPVYAQGAQGAVSQSPQSNRPRSDQPTPLRAAARGAPQQQRASSSMPPPDSMAPKHPSSVPPDLPLGTPIHDVQVSPRLQSGAVPIQHPNHHQAQQEATPRQRSGAVPIQPPPSVRPEAADPEPPPPLADNPARSQRSIAVPPRRRTISASPPPPSAYPPHPSETASTIPPQQKDERPTAAPPPRAAAAQGQTHPQASFVPRPHPHTAPIHTPKAPTPAPQASPPRAAGELRRTPPPVPEAAKSKTPSTPGISAPMNDATFSARPANDNKPPDMRRRRDDEPTLAERPNRANTQRGLQASVPDTALEALSSELRGYPEVEWACVLVDESDVPLIGVRVDPSFLNRVADITDVILDVGERQAVTLQVLLLNNQDQVKNARRNGRAFYPWMTATR